MAARNLGEIYTELTYVRGSLRNLAGGLGWTFCLANPPLPLAGVAEAMFLTVDGGEVPGQQVWVHTGGEVRRVAEVSRSHPLTFQVGQPAVFRVEGAPLPPGAHRVEIHIKPLGFGDIYTRFGFTDQVQAALPELVTRSGFGQPVALANGQAFVVANRAGDLSADWNWFGLETDNGGLYMPPARFLRWLRFAVALDGQAVALSEATVEARLLPGRLEATAVPFPGVTVERAVFVPPGEAAVLLGFTLRNGRTEPVELELRADFAPALVPYGLAGVRLRHFQVQLGGDGLVRCAGPDLPYRVALGAAEAPARARLGEEGGWVAYRLSMPPGGSASLVFGAAGTVDGSDPGPALRRCLERAPVLRAEAEATFAAALAAGYEVDTPDPELNQAWTFARLALHQLCFRHPEIGPGICAGLPRFPNYWSRDSAWSALGLLASGEAGFVRDVIDNFFAHQLLEDRPGAHAGDLPTVISGPAFMHLLGWGTSADGPLLLVILLREYVRQTGDVAFAARHWDGLLRVLAWARRQDRDGDGYLEHGVEATTSHALTIPDNTWMDHIDRRKSGNDIQGLYWHALRCAADLADLLGRPAEAAAWRDEADGLEARFWTDLYPPHAPYPYDRLDLQGQPDGALRPNYAINLLFHTLLDPDRVARALVALDRPELRAPHGIRTLAATHPLYDPISYHHGCVWNLVTGWAAMAALANGRTAQGYGLIRTLAENVLAEFGQAAELYRGDRREAYNGCFLQAWSVGVLLLAVGRYLLGLQPDGVAGVLAVSPHWPAGWTRVAVRGVRVRGAVLDLTLAPAGIRVHNRGGEPATVRWADQSAAVAPGQTLTLGRVEA